MKRTSRRTAAASADEEEQSGSRRSTRTRTKPVIYTQEETDSPKEQHSDSNDSEAEMEVEEADEEMEEVEEEEVEEVAPVRNIRKSSRSTAFRGEMKDPSMSIKDLLQASAESDAPKKRKAIKHKRSSLETSGGDDEEESDYESDVPKRNARRSSNASRASRTSRTSRTSRGSTAKSKIAVVKSPAKRHSKRRMTKRVEFPESSEEESSEEEEEGEGSDDEEDENEDIKIHRIIASRTMTIGEWKEVGKTMNTTEITNGSRWFQEEDTRDPNKYEERFLVKWQNLSFLHCSWETEKDLVELIDNAKTHLKSFFRKSVNGLLYDADERLDGDYFDPSWVQIERILEVSVEEEEEKPKKKKKGSGDVSVVEKYNIILDVTDPEFESGTGRQFYVKWTNTPYSQNSYEFERDLILNEVEYLDQLQSYEGRSVKPSKDEMKKIFKKSDNETRQLYKLFGDKIERDEDKVKEYQQNLEKQVFPNGGQLRDYQAEGVSWLVSNYINRRSSILADEMGLGKTCQSAAFVSTISSQLSKRGPFLVVAPLSTIPHWYREFSAWTNLNTIVYHGSANDRERAREDEFPFPSDRVETVGFNTRYLNKVAKKWKSKPEKTWMVQVVITTPEMLVTDDFSELAAIEWEILIVDEAHRLKNHNSKLAVNLRDHRFKFHHSLLLTGTPIQNNMQELWTLLNFINPEDFDSLDSFMEKYGDIKSKERVDELHETIRPYILRRLKEDVEKSVPPKEETLIEVELTVLQKQYYRALYEKNLKFLHRNKKKALDGPSISNLAMQLRKCCNHPFLLKGVEQDVRKQQPSESVIDSLVNASGKFVLLDKLLPRLKQDGHRILLFSQFKIMLDIIEDYLNLRSFKCERIDGSITGLKRQAAIDRFQSKNSDGREQPFIMLLSTRAGGVGINLTAADTCIIFDSDWNPQNDLQAQARCHRIGQTKNVKIYRILTRKTYEMQMFHMSSLKMGLDQAVLQGIENTGGNKDIMTKEEVEKLLKHGAYDIFKEDKDGTSEKESNDFVSQSIDSILERRTKTVVHENTGSKSNAAGGTFSKASFKNTNTDGIAATEIDVDDPDFWTKVVGEAKEEDDQDDLAGKKRKRTKTNYSEREYLKNLDAKIRGGIDSEDDYKDDDDASAASSDYDDKGEVTDDEDSIDNETLKKILKASKAMKNERYIWGGSAPTDWMQADAEQVLKALQSFGYKNVSFDKFLSTMSLSRAYDHKEIHRMGWALPLIALYEVAENEALESDIKGKQSNEDSLGKTLDSSNADSSSGHEKEGSDPANRLEESFKKLLLANEYWVTKAIADAKVYAQSGRPRDREYVESILNGMPKNTSKENTVQAKLTAAFEENVWPVLRSRGWKNDGEGSKRVALTYNGKTFKSITAVLDVMPKHHPELMPMVNSLVANISSSCSNPNDDSVESTLEYGSVTAKSLKQFLNNFAPLQLVADRIRPNRMGLSKRLLPQLVLLHGLHHLVSSADSNVPVDAPLEDRNLQLSKLIKVHPGTALPHEEWTPLHDAILIRATSKHGWLDRQSCCNAIADDSSIKWGPPFEIPEVTADIQNESDAEKHKEDGDNEFLNAASRATAFLNKHSVLTEEFRGFQVSTLIKMFGITQSKAQEGEAEKECWSVDTEALKSRRESEGTDELPPRKLLLRRAKKIVMASIGNPNNTPDEGKEEKEIGTETETADIQKSETKATTTFGYGVLDQTCPANALLLEMMRGLLKTTQKQDITALNQLTLKEIDARIEDMAKPAGSDESQEAMKKIKNDFQIFVDNVAKTSRTAKNILRVILGIDPVPSKQASGPLFPNDIQKKGTKTASTVAKVVLSRVKKQALTPSDSALNRAMSNLKDIADGKNESKSEDLRLTSTEILLLTVLSSQGLPVFSEDWNSLIDCKTMIDDICLDSFQIYFFAMSGVMKAAAGVWLDIAKKKLSDRIAVYNSASEEMQQKMKQEIAVLKKDAEAKEMTLNDSNYFCSNPMHFARKVIMLLEALRTSMGSVDLKKIKSPNKAENGLGTKVLNWLQKELQRWAVPLELLDKFGRVLSSTSVSENDKHPQSFDAAIMTKRDCRTVIIQIAQQTRLRSIFIKHETSKLSSELIPKAMKQSEWESRPQWWNHRDDSEDKCICKDDLDLLTGILDYGYGGFDCLLKHDFPFCARLNAQEKESSSSFNRACAQARINQLTRELHFLDDSMDMMKLVQSRSGKSKVNSDKTLENNTTKKPSKPLGSLQAGIQAFFKRSSNGDPTSSSKKQKTPPTSPENSDVEIISVDCESRNGDLASKKRKLAEPPFETSSKKQK